jgi:hypothetical protein
MKIYLVAENYDYGPGYYLGEIHKAFKSKEKAEQMAKKLLDEYEWQPFQQSFDIIYVMEMEVEE